ncbi:hypothetical protein HUJ05_001645 [Dendroctonus ponderosae]|nr:hypothetical protein HUJ05_001645 [Dendroctonus ponderosae]
MTHIMKKTETMTTKHILMNSKEITELVHCKCPHKHLIFMILHNLNEFQIQTAHMISRHNQFKELCVVGSRKIRIMPKVVNSEPYQKKYSEEVLKIALEEIENGASKKAVAKKYNIPRSTLQFRKSAKFSKISHEPPPQSNGHQIP